MPKTNSGFLLVGLIAILLLVLVGVLLFVRVPPQPPLRVFAGVPGSDYPPFHTWHPAEKEPTGFEPELVVLIAKQLKRRIEWVLPEGRMSNYRIEMLRAGKADLVVSTFTITEDRLRFVAFSQPYFTDGLGLMVPTGSGIQSPADLAGKRIMAWDGTTGRAWLMRNAPDAVIVSTLGAFDGTEADFLAAGFADAYINDWSPLAAMARRDSRVRLLPERLTTEQWGLALQKGNTKLLTQINQALSTLESTDQLDSLRRKWLVDPIQ